MKTRRLFTLGWGATTLLLTLSIAVAVRLASIGVEALEIIGDESPPAGASALGIVAIIEPTAIDHVSEALQPAIDAAREPAIYSFATFSPGLPPFLAESVAMIETLDIAHAAGVDAIVVRADRRQSLERASDIAREGTLTAVIGSLLPAAPAHIRAGVDPVALGDEISALIETSGEPSSRIGYLCGLCAGAEAPAASRVVGRVRERLPSAEVIVQRVDDVELGSIAAAQALLERGADVVFCDTSEATIAMSQVVINANRVGEVVIIGFGETDRVRSLVEDRVVLASVSADYAAVTERLFATINAVISGSARGETPAVSDPLDLLATLAVIGPEDGAP